MRSLVEILNLRQNEKRKWIVVVAVVAATHLLCQSLMLPYGNALRSLLLENENTAYQKQRFPSRAASFKAGIVSDTAIVKPQLVDTSVLARGVKSAENGNLIGGSRSKLKVTEEDGLPRDGFSFDAEDLDDDLDFVEDTTVIDDNAFNETLDADDEPATESTEDKEKHSIIQKDKENSQGLLLEKVVQDNNKITGDANSNLSPDEIKNIETAERIAEVVPLDAESLLDSSDRGDFKTNATVGGGQSKQLPEVVDQALAISEVFSKNMSLVMQVPAKKKMKCEMPPKTVTTLLEMEQLLVRHRAQSRAMRPRWSSERDREILAAKLQINNAPVLKNDEELHAPVFRNVSVFKRSYALMERTLKIYVYKDGEKPIFHQPILKGLYASEGWFMKLMEANRRFVVKDPRKAHLFYMPFSSRMLEHSLYVRNSHNRTNLRQFLKDYAEKIAAKYRFWNRTGGADHFLVACHDWAPYETRHHMERCIKALCNADVTVGFKIGRDVSLPETYVRSARNPLRDLGGKPPSERHILAFYAGNMHGYLRTILLEHWKGKDPDMKIFGPMPPGVASKMNYIQHMKSSKYCICPKGYEVNSPRIVESIFYECVPVIISDNFVPPFFEVLNWDAFSVIIAEKDIPSLKNILLSIPEEKYLNMQLGVRKIQKHFLWHAKPVKYDLFHMTLHSIWYNRVFQIKSR